MALPPATLAEQLIGCANSPPAWDQVQTTALELANALRSKGPGISPNSLSHFLNIVPLTQDHTPDDIHTTIGQTDLPTALTKLLSAASESSGGDIPSDSAAPATFEVLRVAANVVMDHGMFICISVEPIIKSNPTFRWQSTAAIGCRNHQPASLCFAGVCQGYRCPPPHPTPPGCQDFNRCSTQFELGLS